MLHRYDIHNCTLLYIWLLIVVIVCVLLNFMIFVFITRMGIYITVQYCLWPISYSSHHWMDDVSKKCECVCVCVCVCACVRARVCVHAHALINNSYNKTNKWSDVTIIIYTQYIRTPTWFNLDHLQGSLK